MTFCISLEILDGCFICVVVMVVGTVVVVSFVVVGCVVVGDGVDVVGSVVGVVVVSVVVGVVVVVVVVGSVVVVVGGTAGSGSVAVFDTKTLKYRKQCKYSQIKINGLKTKFAKKNLN